MKILTKTQCNIFTILIILVSSQSFAQKTVNDTIFLLKENYKGIYHSIFIDTDKNSKFYNQISDFSFSEFDKDSYNYSMEYFNENNILLTKTIIKDIPKEWICLKFYKGEFYSYKPSDFYTHYQASINDTTFIDHTGEGPVANKILSFSKTDSITFEFKLNGLYNKERDLVVHIIDEKNGIAVFEEKTTEQDSFYYLMISAEKVRNLPIIVNYCETQKQIEFHFDEPDYKKLLTQKENKIQTQN